MPLDGDPAHQIAIDRVVDDLDLAEQSPLAVVLEADPAVVVRQRHVVANDRRPASHNDAGCALGTRGIRGN